MNLPITEKQRTYLEENSKKHTPGEFSILFGITISQMYWVLTTLKIKCKKASPNQYANLKLVKNKRPKFEGFTEEQKQFMKDNPKMKCRDIAEFLDVPYSHVFKFMGKEKTSANEPKAKIFERPPAIYSNPQYHQIYFQ